MGDCQKLVKETNNLRHMHPNILTLPHNLQAKRVCCGFTKILFCAGGARWIVGMSIISKLASA